MKRTSLPLQRREFITLLGDAAAAWPFAARAQPAMPVIGLLDQRSPDELADRLRGFRQGLKEIGYVEGENVVIEYRWAEGQYDRLPELAAELVRRQVSVIATTGGHPAAFTAKAATTTIPIVFIASEDPVRLGLVASLARPGGNLTGVNFLSGELTAKRLELFHELVPAATRVAVLVNPANAVNVEATLREVGVAARAIGLQIQIVNAGTIREISSAFATFVRERADAVFVGIDPFFNSRRTQIGPLGEPPRVPSVISRARLCRSRWADELRSQHCGCVAPGRLLCGTHPQGCQARGLAGCPLHQIRADHQRPDRHDAWPRRAGTTARPRRRGDRVRRREFITLLGAAAAGPRAA